MIKQRILQFIIYATILIGQASAQIAYKNYMPLDKGKWRIQKKLYYENDTEPYRCDVYKYDKKGLLASIAIITKVNGKFEVSAQKNITYLKKGIGCNVNLVNKNGNVKMGEYFFDTKNHRLKLAVEYKRPGKNVIIQDRYYLNYENRAITGYVCKSENGNVTSSLKLSYAENKLTSIILTRGAPQKYTLYRKNKLIDSILVTTFQNNEIVNEEIIKLAYNKDLLTDINETGQKIHFEYDQNGNLSKKLYHSDAGNVIQEFVYEEKPGNAALFEMRFSNIYDWIPDIAISKIK